MNSRLNSRNLLHHLFIDSQTTGSIHNHHIIAVHTGFLNRMLRFGNGIGLGGFVEHIYSNLFAQHANLLNSCRTIDIASHKHHFLLLLLLQVVGQLGRESSLTGALKTRHQDHSRLTFEVDLGRLPTHEGSQFIVGDFYEKLTGTDGAHHVLTDSLLFHRVGELLGGLIVDIGLKERLADVLDSLGDVNFCNASFAFEDLKRTL